MRVCTRMVCALVLGVLPAVASADEGEQGQATMTPAPYRASGRLASVERTPGNGRPACGDPVLTWAREFKTTTVDVHLGGIRALAFTRHYGTFLGAAAGAWGFHGPGDSPMGANWTHNHHVLLLRIDRRHVAVSYQQGAVIFFAKSSGTWSMTAAPVGFVYMGVPYQMVESGTKLSMMDPHHRLILTFEFDSLADGAVTGVEEVRDRNGNPHTYAYNADGTLAQVADAYGRSLAFDYVTKASIPRVKSVTDQTGRAVSFTYTTSGALKSATLARGNTTSYTYDAGFRLLTLTRPQGNVAVTNTYAGTRVASQIDGEGNLWGFAAGGGGTRITDPLGHQRVHGFDGLARLTQVVDEAGKAATMTYDASMRLVSLTDRRGATSSLGYHDPSGLVASRTDALGHTWTYGYEAQAQDGFTFYELARIEDPEGAVETFTRDARGNVVARTDRKGQTTSSSYDASGLRTSLTNPKGGVTTLTYAGDMLAGAQDPAGNVTTYAYDAAFRITQIIGPDGSTRVRVWDANDNLVAATDENGHATTFAYDANDNLVARTDPLGNTTTFAYDGNDDLVAVSDPLGATATLEYDGRRRLVRRTDPEGATTSAVFDARGRQVARIDPDGQTWSATYDDEDVLTSTSNPLGETATYESDALGRFTRIADALGNAVQLEYDGLGRTVRTTDPRGGSVQVDYDAEGFVRKIEMPEEGVRARYGRDGLDALTRVRDPRGHVWRYRQDEQGRPLDETDPVGHGTAYQHDARNRLDVVTLPGSLGALDLEFDAASRRVRSVYSDGTDLSFAYDAGDRLTSATGMSLSYDGDDRVTDCNGLSMSWDADDRLASVTLAPGKTVTYAYDARDLLVAVADWVGGVTSFTYDAAGRLTTWTRPNGIASTYSYDAAGRLVRVEESGLGESRIERDARGQITRIDRDLPDAAQRPAPGERSFSYDGACQLATASYDALGRLTQDGARVYEWDLASRLIGVDAGSGHVAYAHDAAGNLISRTEAGATCDYVWNYALGLPSIAVARGSGADQTYYVHTPGGRLLYRIDAASGARRFFHFDHQGSTLLLTDDAGSVTDAYAYAPYGELLAHSGSSENPFTWHGQLGVMADGGLYHMRARWYDPASMRFLSRDPIRGQDPVRVNPYQALFGDPVNLTDPTGLDPPDDDGFDPSVLDNDLAGRILRHFYSWNPKKPGASDPGDEAHLISFFWRFVGGIQAGDPRLYAEHLKALSAVYSDRTDDCQYEPWGFWSAVHCIHPDHDHRSSQTLDTTNNLVASEAGYRESGSDRRFDLPGLPREKRAIAFLIGSPQILPCLHEYLGGAAQGASAPETLEPPEHEYETYDS